MYELIGVSTSIVTSYIEAIEKADKHPNANSIFVVAVKNTFHVLDQLLRFKFELLNVRF